MIYLIEIWSWSLAPVQASAPSLRKWHFLGTPPAPSVDFIKLEKEQPTAARTRPWHCGRAMVVGTGLSLFASSRVPILSLFLGWIPLSKLAQVSFYLYVWAAQRTDESLDLSHLTYPFPYSALALQAMILQTAFRSEMSSFFQGCK